MLAPHTKARSPHPAYPSRFHVPDNKVPWSAPFPEYNPPDFTANSVILNDCTKKENGWADPQDIDAESLKSRKSYCGKIQVVGDAPRNPVGRTGLKGRGLLGKWGPNHAADPIVTRWNKDALEMVVIQRKDTKEWAIPGGMVDAGERVSATLKREFGEEAMGDLSESDQHDVQRQIDELFSSEGTEIYRGYVDDPRNTDNAWMETVAVHFECPPELGHKLRLQAADDAMNVRWLRINNPDGSLPNLYASHTEFVRKVLERVTKQSKTEVTQPAKAKDDSFLMWVFAAFLLAVILIGLLVM
eukprot:c4653_g1_i1.p1 GENE.c4653_g1_i1~~c4653_g1_i1.p1  ORF type:complete len:300 (+),score=70.62 c4653_g1_i1:42-941(+)